MVGIKADHFLFPSFIFKYLDENLLAFTGFGITLTIISSISTLQRTVNLTS